MLSINVASRATPIFSRTLVGLAVAVAVSVGLSPNLAAEPKLGSGWVFTANEEGGGISRIDLQTGKTQTIELPIMPHNVDLSARAGLVFVVGVGRNANDGMSGQGAGMTMTTMTTMTMGEGAAEEPGGRLAILKIDAVDQGPVATIDIGHHPAHVVPDQDGKRVFVTDSEANTVSVIDLGTRSVVNTIPTGRYPHGLRLAPDGRELFVANVEDGTVSVIDVATLTEAARIPVGRTPVQVAFTPDGSRVFVSLRDEDSVAVIDRLTRQLLAKIPVGRRPIQLYVTPDAGFVYVADQGSDTDPDNRVSIIDIASGKVVKTLTVGTGAHGVTISRDGQFVYVTNIKDNSVSVIDAASQTVVGTVPVGRGPNGIAFLPAN